MDYRRDLLPPLLALGFSLGLHGALFGVQAPWWRRPPEEPVDTVILEFFDESPGASAGQPAAEAPAPPAAPPAAPRPAASVPPPEPPPPPEPAPVPRAAPPRAEVAPEPVPATVAKAPEPVPPTAPLQEAPPAPAPTPAPLEVVPPPPRVADLLPTTGELHRFAGRTELPDPAAPGVREATLSLGNEDLRYRGYLQTVHASIDRSEKWKEAVLMGGGGGVVVVRLTITALGQLVSAEVTRSSGSHLLDSAALDAVRRARIPPFPAHWKIEKLHLHAQFNYQLVTY